MAGAGEGAPVARDLRVEPGATMHLDGRLRVTAGQVSDAAGQKVLTALNRWLYARGHDYIEAHRGYVTTLSILVAKSRTAHLFHVGDTRIQRWRSGGLEPLTRDHATRISEPGRGWRGAGEDRPGADRRGAAGG